MNPVLPPRKRLPEVHHWLVESGCWRSQETTPTPALVIEQFTGKSVPKLASRLARHLQAYDPLERHWLDFSGPLLKIIGRDQASLALLGHPSLSADRHELVRRLTGTGPAVIEGEGVLAAAGNEAFRVALTGNGVPGDPYHLVADPRRFDSGCLVAVIGDAFLEWLSRRDRVTAAT